MQCKSNIIFLILFAMVSLPTFALPLTILGTVGQTQELPFKDLNSTSIPTIQSFSPISPLAALAPAPSNMTLGQVISHPIENTSQWRTPLFIVGDDETSKQWLQKNSVYLHEIHAIGIGVGFKNPSKLNALSQQFYLPIITPQLSGLENLIGENHYPLLIAKGWVVQ